MKEWYFRVLAFLAVLGLGVIAYGIFRLGDAYLQCGCSSLFVPVEATDVFTPTLTDVPATETPVVGPSATPVPPTATRLGETPTPSATPEPTSPPTSTSEPPTEEPRESCNRGTGNDSEGCDPGNSGGKPGNAGEGHEGFVGVTIV